MDSPSSVVASYSSPYERRCPPLDPGRAASPPTQHRRAPHYLGHSAIRMSPQPPIVTPVGRRTRSKKTVSSGEARGLP
ncbi:unnamed protein product [Linum trigynum]|uniref:Uncharacterized protein n=1 Tax=Linum trigynum TaxID=586398 RepID=A0AAV2FQP6_9ROSI